MGMYTELFVEGTLRGTAPQAVKDVIHRLFDPNADRSDDTCAIDHPFFKASRWAAIGNCSSYYHIPYSLSGTNVSEVTNQLSFISRSDLKNYGNEIELFINWITPYCERLRGWHWYEEAPEPTVFNYESY